MVRYKVYGEKNEVDSLNGLVTIEPIGYGGAFATKEGHSSFVVQDLKSEKRLLIDCGSLVYKSLRDRKLTDKIDWILITHTHEDHIGSLSSLIYENFYVHNRKINIICHSSVRHQINEYLITVCNHDFSQYEFPYYYEESFKEDFPNLELEFFGTANLHFLNLATAGFILKVADSDFKAVFSGDLGLFVGDVLDLDKSEIEGDNYLVFQDAGTYKFTKETHEVIPHAYYKDCDYKNVYLYHHFKGEVNTINAELKNAVSISPIVTSERKFLIYK